MSLVQSAISSIRKKADEILNDNQGWFRGGKFTPGQQIQSIQQDSRENSPLTSVGPFVLPNFQNKQLVNTLANQPRMELPTWNNAPIVPKFVYNNLVKPVIESNINIPRNLSTGTARIYKELDASKTRPINANNIIQGVMPLGEGAFDLATLGTTSIGKNIAKEAAKDVVKGGILKSAGKGAITGGFIGGLGGMSREVDAQYGGKADPYKMLTQGGVGALIGGTLGGIIGGGSAAWEKRIETVTRKIIGLKPDMPPQQAEKEAVRYLKNKVTGLFTGSKSNYKTQDEIRFYGDLNESLGLDRFDRHQIGQGIVNITPEEHALIKAKGVIPEGKGITVEGKVKVPYYGEINKSDLPIYEQWKNQKSMVRFDEYLKQVKSSSPSIPSVKTNGRLKIKPTELGTPQTPQLNPNRLQTDPLLSSPQTQTPIVQTPSGLKVKTPVPSDGSVPRGFTTSAQEAPNIGVQTKTGITGEYIPKPNQQLMGEATALLQDGASLDFKNVKNLDQKVAAAMKEAINLDAQGRHDEAAALFNNLAEHGTELGRSVQAFSLLQQMSPQAIAMSVAKKIQKYNMTAVKKIPELTGEQQKIISDMVNTVDLLKGREKNIALNELNNTINSFIPTPFVDKALAVWKAGLLTSFRTHERNFVGNTIHGAMETLKDIPAAGADILMSGKTGQRSMSVTAHGIENFASKSTRQQVADIVSKGYDPSETINKFDYKQINWGNSPAGKFFKGYTDAVFRTLGASDKPFYNAAMSRSLYDQAGTAAINAGKRGDASFIESLVKKPTEDMIKIAIGDANTATFKTKNGASKVANAVKRAMGDKWYGKLAAEVTMPFTGVPSSILGQITAYSPIGLIRGAVDAGKVTLGNMPQLQRQAAQEIGRGVIGTGIFGLGAYLMSKGIITGQPKDAEEARLWDSQNKPRNSIMIGGKWRSLNSIGPESVVMLAGAKLNEELSKPDGSLANYGVSLGKDYLDQSFVQGLQGPVNAITDPNRYAKSYVGSLISSPIPNIVKDVSRGFDPYQRESNTVMDYAKSGVPGLRNTMTPKRDVLGNIMQQEPTGLAAGLDLFNSKTPISTPVIDELNRLYNGGNGATPSKLSGSQTILGQKQKLDPNQLNNLEAGVGEVLRPQLESLINSPAYQSLTDEAKSNAVSNLVSTTRNKYKNLNASSITDNTVPTNPLVGGASTTDMGYVTDTGSYQTYDLTKLDKIAQLPETNKYQQAIKESKQYSTAATILDNTNLSQEQQQTALTRLGIDPDKASYYQVANDNTNLKTMFVLDSINKVKTQGGGFSDVVSLLANQRTEVNGQMIASNAVVDNLVDEGILTKAQATELKKYKFENGQLTPVKKLTAAKPKKISITARRMSAPPKLSSPKVAKSKRLKISYKKLKPVKLKLPSVKG